MATSKKNLRGRKPKKTKEQMRKSRSESRKAQRGQSGKRSSKRRFIKDVAARGDKWMNRGVNVIKKLGIAPGKDIKEGNIGRAVAKSLGSMAIMYPATALALGDMGVRGAKRLITGKSKGGSVKLAKKYFKGGMV